MKKVLLKLTPILFLALFASCKGKIIPKNKMVAIIGELYIVDATVNRYIYEISSKTRDSVKYYAPVFEKYGYDADKFRESMIYYAGISGALNGIYKQVGENLKKSKEKLRPEVRLEELSKNMWSGGDSISLNRVKYFSPISSEATLKEKGVYDISVDYLFFKDDSTVNPKMEIILFSTVPIDSIAGSKDTLIKRDTILVKDTLLRSYHFTINVEDIRYNKLKVNWFIGDSVNLKKIPRFIKEKGNKRKKQIEDSIVGKQNLRLKNMTIRYNFDKSDFKYDQMPEEEVVGQVSNAKTKDKNLKKLDSKELPEIRERSVVK